MRKQIVLVAAISGMLAPITAMAGGLLTNTNQSASYIRMVARNASTEVDAVYYNPAGLTKLNDGFHFSVNNQSAFQTRTITNSHPLLNSNSFEGKTAAYLVPSVHGVYKTGDWAFSASFHVNGGGGVVDFKKGLPLFETQIAGLRAMLNENVPTTEYSADIAFKGSSVNFGYQAGISYKINEMLSVFAGARYITVKSGYEGHLNSIMVNPAHPMLNPTGEMMLASDFFTAAATAAGSTVTSLQPLIDGGGSTLTVDQAQGNGFLTPTQAAQIKGGLGDSYNAAMTIAQVQGAYSVLQQTNAQYAGLTADKAVDVEQTGSGITPIVGLNFSYGNLNVAAKYEFKTKIDITNNTTIDQTGMFPDGLKTPNDIPALLTLGAEYRLIPQLKVALGYNHFFDKDAKMPNDKQTYIDHGINEYLAGAEFDVNKYFLLSAGWQYTQSGVKPEYQSDMSYSLNSYSVGLGGAVKLNENLRVNVGYFFTKYAEGEKSIDYGAPIGVQTETYNRTNNVFSAGVDFSF